MTAAVRMEAVSRALKMLDASGAEYAVRIDGQSFGTLPVVNGNANAEHSAWTRYPRGVTRAHYWPYIKDMRPGDVAEVPFSGFDPRTLRSNIGSACIHAWGTGSAVIVSDQDRQVVSVLRVL